MSIRPWYIHTVAQRWLVWLESFNSVPAKLLGREAETNGFLFHFRKLRVLWYNLFHCTNDTYKFLPSGLEFLIFGFLEGHEIGCLLRY